MMENLLSLGRFLALVLRHQGPQMGLSFDSEGFTDLSALLALLRNNPVFEWAGRREVEAVVQADSKGRYEIQGARIRATYGHSVSIPVNYPPLEPPAKLFHGTTGQAILEIQKSGLRPQGRAYVHLSLDEETAFLVGRRRVVRPLVLEVASGAAHKAGVEFYRPSKHLYVTRHVPPEYLQMKEPRRAGTRSSR